MENKNVVFCNIAWMKNYCGVNPDDKAVNGGKYVDEHDGECQDVNNFLVHNHKCYGYFMHYGENLDLKRINDKFSKVDAANDITVVWVATKPETGGRYIVGWYENAKIYRKWQYYIDRFLGVEAEQDYNFEADASNCYLIPEDLREFKIPSATINGKGKGMGKSSIWYADGDWARNEFVPEVLTYLDKVKDKCQKLANDFSHEELYAPASDKLDSLGDIYELLDDLEQENWYHSDWKRILGLYNLAVEVYGSADVYWFRGFCFHKLFYLDEAIADYKKSLALDSNNFPLKFNLIECYMALKNYTAGIILGEQIVKEYNEEENLTVKTTQGVFDLYEILSLLYYLEGEYEESLKYVNKMKNVRFIDHKDFVREREEIVLEAMNQESK